jgi:sialic acid synthase SpsE
LKLGDRHIEQGELPYVIAEIGVNHDGSSERARELIRAAKTAGADAVKFQYFESERLLSRDARLAAYQRSAGASDPFDMLRSLELSIESLESFAKFARGIGLDPIVTIFSLEHVEPACQIDWAALKIASPDIINRPLLDALKEVRKPMILSTGAASAEEVEEAVRWMGKASFALTHCVSAYPTPEDVAQLGGIRALRDMVDVPVGYSDHTIAEDMGALAIAAGAMLLEKHLTYDRAATGPDHSMSLEPLQFTRYVQAAHRAARVLGQARKFVQDIERDVRSVSRQSIAVVRELKSGHVLQRCDLTVKRPGGGIVPSRLDELIGRRLRCDVADHAIVRDEHLEAVQVHDRTAARGPQLARH